MRRRLQTRYIVGGVIAMMTLASCSSDDDSGEQEQVAETASEDPDSEDPDSEDPDSEDPDSEDPDPGSLMIYYGMPSEQIEPLIEEFAAAHPDIAVDSFRQPTEELMTTLRLEHGAGTNRADIILSGSGGPAAFELENPGALEPYVSPNLEELPEEFQEGDGTVTLYGVLGYTLGYNSEMISEDELPDSWLGLLDAEWDGQISMADPRSATGVHQFIWFIADHLADTEGFGWDYFENLAQNSPRLGDGHGGLGEWMLSGEHPIAPIVAPSVPATLIAAGEPVGMAWPSEGIPLTAAEVAILSGTENMPEAQAFIDWLLTLEGQEAVMNHAGLVPAHPDVEDAHLGDGTTLAEVESVLVPPGVLDANVAEYIDGFHDAISRGGS